MIQIEIKDYLLIERYYKTLYSTQRLYYIPQRQPLMKTIEAYSFRPEDQLGKGYSSTVHRGIHNPTGNPVAIKAIEMDKLQDPINQMLLQLQVNALRALTHSQHVLRLHDVFATRNNTYIVTELCDGDLSSVLKQKKQMNYFQAVEVLRQLVEGYRDINRAGYLHRDIKPANILYRDGIYKFADFGFAIPVQDTHLHGHYNVGSPIYMPPEALKNNVYSLSCDLWALGVIFYYMLKGQLPWRAISEKVLHQKMITEPIDMISQGLPSAARQFLSRVLHLNPSQRLGVDQLVEWPKRLKSAPVEMRKSMTVYPEKQNRPRLIQPLAEISLNQSVKQQPMKASIDKTVCSPNIIKASILAESVPLQPPRVSLTQPRSKDPMVEEKEECNNERECGKQAHNFCSNSINYVRFLHRILQFMAAPTPLDLTDLIESIGSLLFRELSQIKLAFESGECFGVQGWRLFSASEKGQLLRKKLLICEAKYKMLHEHSVKTVDVESIQVMTAIDALMKAIDGEYKSRWVVLADYLSTLYQLLHLRQKYSSSQFMRMSRMQLIMEGTPYHACPQHIDRLKRKILLIRP